MDGDDMRLVEGRQVELAGLHTCLIGTLPAARLTVVLLHGYGMDSMDFAPFAHSLAIPGVAYAFPQGSLTAGGGYSWWVADKRERQAAELRDARDLAEEHPSGRARARAQMRELLAALRTRTEGKIVLAGFSQGGMLAADTVLLEPVEVDGLAMMSASCIALDEWRMRADRLQGMRSFVSHGRTDPDLAFSAGERLKNFLSKSGARVTWVPFEGGHEVPFQVWRQFRHFLGAISQLTPATDEKTRRYGTH